MKSLLLVLLLSVLSGCQALPTNESKADPPMLINSTPETVTLSGDTKPVPVVESHKDASNKISIVPVGPVVPSSTSSPNTTTHAPNTTTIAPNTTTVAPNTTTLSPKTSTPVPTTTVSPNSTTVAPPTTPKPPVPPTTKPTEKPTVTPSPHPIITTTPSAPSSRGFDGPSFIGGIVLASGLMAIGFVALKFYRARTELNYHTL